MNEGFISIVRHLDNILPTKLVAACFYIMFKKETKRKFAYDILANSRVNLDVICFSVTHFQLKRLEMIIKTMSWICARPDLGLKRPLGLYNLGVLHPSLRRIAPPTRL